MYPHERSLVLKMEGKPFALVGVNSDKSKSDVKKATKAEKITWRSFWNGGSTSGPISQKWKVKGWPTLLVIDAKGIIRYRWEGSPGGEKMDKAIEAVMAEMERDSKAE